MFKKQGRRTDMATELRELYHETHPGEIDGIECLEEQSGGVTITAIRVLNETGSQKLGKPLGNYITLSTESNWQNDNDYIYSISKEIARALTALVPEKGPVLIVGLGNRSITADSLGPYVLEKVIVTRHLLATMPDAFSGFRDVSAVATGVLGVTGIETQEIVKGLCQHIKPACIIAIDALASRSLDRLGRTFQLSDSGIIPGEGAQNRRFSIDKETTGVPVIAIGVPTVVEALTLALDLMGDAFHEQVLPAGGDFLVTPSGIDALISKSAKAIGYGINLALHGDMSLSDMEQFLF